MTKKIINNAIINKENKESIFEVEKKEKGTNKSIYIKRSYNKKIEELAKKHETTYSNIVSAIFKNYFDK